MKVKVGVRHNLVGPLGGYHPGVGDARSFARKMRPNAFEAVALFQSDWQGHEVQTPLDGTLMLTVMMDHVGTMAPNHRVVRLRDDWAAVIHMNRSSLMDGARERSIGDIADDLEAQALSIVARISLQRPQGAVIPPQGWEMRRI